MNEHSQQMLPNGKPYNIYARTVLFAKEVIAFTSEAKKSQIFQSVFDQLVRSATSIGANVIEGQAGSSRSDWLRFLNYALKSANESVYWLETIIAIPQTDVKRASELKIESQEIAKILGAIIVKVKRKN